jgi:vacuolar-type H+-ATPase subunit I/STV1
MKSSDSTIAEHSPGLLPDDVPPAAAEGADLEQLEVQIRERLERVMTRARAVSKSAKHLLQQGRALTELRQVAEELVGRQNQELEELVDRERRLRRERLAKIRACRADVERMVELRELTIDAREEAWRRYQTIDVAGSVAWFRELAKMRLNHDEEWRACATG